jgi:hypothetical protein
MNMSNGVFSAFQSNNSKVSVKMNWDDDRLVYVVREPFLSKHSRIDLTAGIISSVAPLVIESHMPFNGVIFSDGVESDFIHFNAGTKVTITIAKQKACIVLGK